MTRFQFVPATKTGTFARIALAGAGGAGKTWTALTIARALGDNTGLIDTEHRSAAKYSDLFKFQHLVMTSFDPAHLTEAIADAAEQNINPLIVDSWSHFWEGVDGMLEQVDKATAKSGRTDKFGVGWKEMRPVERRMVEAMLAYPGHLIVCLRAKQEYVLQANSAGKIEPKRIGMKPIQRDGIEHEFDVFADMSDGGHLVVSKSRCPALTNVVIDKPTDDLGYTIKAWLEADAVGEPLNPLTIRDWILADGRTRDELKTKLEELHTIGLAGAAVNHLDDGKTYSLEELTYSQARHLRAAEEAALKNATREAAIASNRTAEAAA